MNKKKIIFTIIFFISFSLLSKSQNNIDSLINLLNTDYSDIEDTNKVNLVNKIAVNYYFSEPDKSLEFALQSEKLSTKLNFKKGIAESIKIKAIAYYVKGNYDTSLVFFLSALKIYEELNDIKNIGSCYNNMGNINWVLNNIEAAIVSYNHAAEYFKRNNNESGLATIYMNLGAMYSEKKESEKAMEYFFQSLEIFSKINDNESIAGLYNNIGYQYLKSNKFRKSIEYFEKCIDLYIKLEQKFNLPVVYTNIAEAYFGLSDFGKGIEYLNLSLEISHQSGAKEQEKDAHFGLYMYYDSIQNFEQALVHYIAFSQINDSIFNLEKTNFIQELETKFNTEKKEKENELLKTLNENSKLTIKFQKSLIIFFIVILILLIISIYLLYRANKLKKSANNILTAKNAEISQQKEEIQSQNEILHQQKEEIIAQRDEIEKQRDILSEQNRKVLIQNKEITDSINYASRIQSALFPSEKEFRNHFQDMFILHLPKDIVSGDFYWFRNLNGLLFFAVADCTGHGVPGAFMSILGISFLNEIVNTYKITRPDEILNNLRVLVKLALKQTEIKSERKDGMDIALCVYNSANSTLEFSGANNSMYLIRENELTEYKSTRNPIGIYIKEINFNNETVNINQNDLIYLFSDGFADQFGGEKFEKFKTERFKRLILSTINPIMDKQLSEIKSVFVNWKKNVKQFDDVIILGLKF